MVRQTPSRRAASLLGGLILCAAPVVAQQAEGPRAAAPPSGTVPLVPEVKQVKLDGVLDEEAWGRSLRLTDFTEVDPDQGAPGDPPTEVWLMRDELALYLAFVCMEPDPESMVLQQLRRDAFLDDDDRMEFFFDPFGDGKSAYFFQIAASGSRGDALLANSGRTFIKAWDGHWTGVTRILEDRWIAEIRIPFTTVRLGEQGDWKANFERFRGSDRSKYRWANPVRAIGFFRIPPAGELGGFTQLDQGLGLEFRPFYNLRYQEETGDEDLLGDLGGEISWSITPQLRASVTWNTDFAETEVDERRVNLTRFPLFFPEKRDFFLQDSSLFQFGQIGRGANDVRPFFSRRIGLADGVEVPLDAGLRVAGRVGPWDLGFLGVRTGEQASAGVPDGDLFVFRPALHVNREITVGSLLTMGNPLSDGDNLVAGADLRWIKNDLFPGSDFSWNNFLVWSDDEDLDQEGLGFGSQATLETLRWRYEAGIVGTQDDFSPGMGFIRRPGQAKTSGVIQFTTEPTSTGLVRFYRANLSPTVWTDLSGDTVSSRVDFNALELQLQSGDALRLGAIVETDRPDFAFTVADDVLLQPGTYGWTRWVARLTSSDNRPIAGRVTVTTGNWYDGDLTQLRTDLDWRPNRHFQAKFEYNLDKGDLPTGEFTVRVERLMLDFALNPELSLETMIQADNQSDTLGLQSRLRWIIEDGRELFLVVDSGWEELPGGAIVPTGSDVTVKAVYAIRI